MNAIVSSTEGTPKTYQTVTNTVVSFVVLGLASAIIYLFANAVVVGTALMQIPVPEIQAVVLNNFEKGPGQIMVQLNFPKMPRGNLVSLQTEGPTQADLRLSQFGGKLPEKPNVSFKMKDSVHLELSSESETRLILNNMELVFGEPLDAALLNDVARFIIQEGILNKDKALDKNPEKSLVKPPNVEVTISTRVVLKSFMMPIGVSINHVQKVNLKDQLIKVVESMKLKTPSPSKPDQEEEKKPLEPGDVKGKKEIEREAAKKSAIGKFDFKPRSVKVAGSDKDSFNLVAKMALPAVMVPDFLYVQVPEMQFQVAYFIQPKESELKIPSIKRVLVVAVERFALQPAVKDDLSDEIPIEVSLKISKDDANGLKELLTLIKDQNFGNLEIQVKPNESFSSKLEAGGLMYLFKDIFLDLPVGAFIAKAQSESVKASKDLNSAPAKSVKESEVKTVEKPTPKYAKKVVAIKLESFKKVTSTAADGTVEVGGAIQIKLRITRDFIGFLQGSLPNLSFALDLHNGRNLLNLAIGSKPINPTDTHIDVLISLTFKNLSNMINTAIKVGNLAKPGLYRINDDLAGITGLYIRGSKDNLISDLLNTFSLDVQLSKSHSGVESVKFIGSKKPLFVDTSGEEKKAIPSVPIKESSVQSKERPDQGKKSPDQDEGPSAQSSLKAPKKNSQREVAAELVISNAADKLKIGARLAVKPRKYLGDFVSLRWGSFILALEYEEKALLSFEIDAGFVNTGITGGIDVFSGKFMASVVLPSNEAEINNLLVFQNHLTLCKKDGATVFSKDSEIERNLVKVNLVLGNLKKRDIISLEAKVPCLKMLKSSSDDPQAAVPSGKSTAPAVERSDFLGKLKNSAIQLISLEVPKLLFQLTYPNGYYCTEASKKEFDTKITVKAFLPTVEVNLCVKDSLTSCLVQGGTANPIAFESEIIDGQICFLKSQVKPSERAASDKSSSGGLPDSFEHENNEIPLKVSIIDIPAVVRFADMMSAKQPQVLTIGPLKDSSLFNKFIGIVGGGFVEIPLNDEKLQEDIYDLEDSLMKSIKKKGSKTEDGKTEKAKELETPEVSTSGAAREAPWSPDEPFALDVSVSSPSPKEFLLAVGVKMSERVFEGIERATSAENMFKWPVLQWGDISYVTGIKDVFDVSIGVSRGQVDVKPEGLAVSVLQDFLLNFRVKVDERVAFGSTGMRQLMGILTAYLQKLPIERTRDQDLQRFIEASKHRELFYIYKIEGFQGAWDKRNYIAESHFNLGEALQLFDALLYREKPAKNDEKKESREKDEGKLSGENVGVRVVDGAVKQSDPFSNVFVSLNSITLNEPTMFNLPCLIPALCAEDLLLDQTYKGSSEAKFLIEIRNALMPATSLIAQNVVPLLENFHFSNFPSHFQLKFRSATPIQLTFLLNGVGLATIGLEPFEFTRSTPVAYKGAIAVGNVAGAAPNELEPDAFALEFAVQIPSTIYGLRETLNVVRKALIFSFPIAPIFFSSQAVPVLLSNPPMHIAFSSENGKTQNLLSTIMASAVGELVLPGLNVKEDAKPKDALPAAENGPQSSSDQSAFDWGSFDWVTLLKIGTCWVTRKSNCANRYDQKLNIHLPFEVDKVKFIFPKTVLFQTIYRQSPIFQFVLDSRRGNQLVIDQENGVDVLGLASISLSGVKNKFVSSKGPQSSALPSSDASSAATTVEFLVKFGSDFGFSSKLSIPVDVITEYIKSQTLGRITSYFWGPSASGRPVKMAAIPTVNTQNSLSLPAQKELEKIWEKQRVCIGKTSNQEPLTDGDFKYSNSWIFYDGARPEILPNQPTTLYLQLRRNNESPICGCPEEAMNLKLKLEREESDAGFIKLVSLFESPAPTSTVGKEFSAKFDFRSNLFVIPIELPFTGRWKASLIVSSGSHRLPYVVIYVKHPY